MLQCASTTRQLLRQMCYAACLNDWNRRRVLHAHCCSANKISDTERGDCNFSLCVYIYEPIKHINNHSNKMKVGLSFLFNLTTFFSYISSRVSNVGYVWVTGLRKRRGKSTVRHFHTDIELRGPIDWNSCFVFTKSWVQISVIISPGK